MAERVTRITPDGVVEHTRFTRSEIRMMWDKAQYVTDQSRSRVKRYPDLSEEAALELSAIWYRQFCTDQASITYRNGELIVYFTAADRGGLEEAWRKQLLAYEMVGADERGPLFADPDSREINPLPLLRAVNQVLTDPVLGMDHVAISDVLQNALAEAYGEQPCEK